MRSRLLLGLLAGMACTGLVSCGEETSPEAQIEVLIGQLEHAVESGALTDAAELLADGYQDDYHPNKAAAMRSLFAYTRRQRSLHLFTLIDSIDVNDAMTAAQAVAHVAVTRVPVESVESLVSLNASLYRFDVGLTVVDGDWQFETAKWRRVGPGALH